jgi:hypothetical protein
VAILSRFLVASISLHVAVQLLAVQLLADDMARFMRNDVFQSQLYLGYLVRGAQVAGPWIH